MHGLLKFTVGIWDCVNEILDHFTVLIDVPQCVLLQVHHPQVNGLLSMGVCMHVCDGVRVGVCTSPRSVFMFLHDEVSILSKEEKKSEKEAVAGMP